MTTDNKWTENEIFALAGFDHEKADILRVILSTVEFPGYWETVKDLVVQQASADTLRKVLRTRTEEAAAYSDYAEDWRQVEIARLEEIEPTLAIFAADAVKQMPSRDVWMEVIDLITEAQDIAASSEIEGNEKQAAKPTRYLIDKTDFNYLPQNIQKDMPQHIKHLVDWDNQFTRLGALADLEKLRALGNRFPHCDRVIEGIAQGIERDWGMGSDIIHIQPILLVGEPGVGKTAFAREVCKILGLHSRIANVGGKAENHLFGLSAGWSTAHAGIVTEAVATAQVLNPVIVLDEIDKTHAGHNGDIAGELLGLLEPTEARRYREKYLSAEVDASHVSWVLTANDLGKVPAPLCSRCTVYEIPQPKLDQLPAIIRSLVDEYAAEHGLRREFFSLDVGDVEALADTYEKHRSIRILYRFVRGLLHQKSHDLTRN